MSSLITVQALSAATPDGRTLFSDITLAFGAERTGLIGRNGVGKSTLLRIMAGAGATKSGSVARSGSIGVLRQIVQPDPHETIADALGVRNALDVIARVLAGDGSEHDLAAADWALDQRIADALAAVGLAGLDPARPLLSLSGGQRTRVSLAALIFAQPDMILLDEPTNNLDAEGREAVAAVLRHWKGGAVVVSHDRDLLRTMDRIVALTTLGAEIYGGNWDVYVARNAEAQAAAEQQLASAERRTKLVEREAQAARERKTKRDAAGKRFAASGSAPKILLGAQKQRAEQSGGRETVLADRLRSDAAERAADARARVEIFRTLDFEIAPSGIAPGRMVLAFEQVTGGPAPEVTPIRGLSFTITGPERIAVTGPNGAGKSTLLRLAAGEIAPVSGTIRRSRIALLDQQVSLLDPESTILDNYRRLNPQEGVHDAHAALARFLFRNEAALKTVGALSGGEMLRAGLACVLGSARPPELLMLDEPTNHLDIASVEAVEAALCGYDGALLVVSHDPDFLAAIGVEREIELLNSNI